MTVPSSHVFLTLFYQDFFDSVLSSQDFFGLFSIITRFFLDSFLSSQDFFDSSIITRMFYSSIITRIVLTVIFLDSVLSQDFFDCSIITRVGMSLNAGKHVGLLLSSECLRYAALYLSSTHSPHSTLTRGYIFLKRRGVRWGGKANRFPSWVKEKTKQRAKLTGKASMFL